MTKITLICTVYNIKDYLKFTLDTIENQTDKNFNIILVDDCSSDGSEVMCDDFCERWNKLNSTNAKVIHNERNRDASYTREIGILSAETEYVYLLDSDDLIHPQLIEIGNKILCNNTYDMVVNKKVSMLSEIMEHPKWKIFDSEKMSFVYDVSSESFYERYSRFGGSIANRFIKKDLITSFNYDVYKEKYPQFYFDDGLVTDLLFYEAKKVAYIDAPIYYYRIRFGGIGSNARNLEHEKEWCESDKDLLNWYKSINQEKIYLKKLKGYMNNVMKYYYIVRKSNKCNDKAVLGYINQEYQFVRQQIKAEKCKLSLGERINRFIFSINKNLWCIMVGNLYFNYFQNRIRKSKAESSYDFLN